ncbi:MAG: hypothetical protein LBU32_08015 [Clostridiales bacterium]|nr:hypothetical protein [Clostridiales bacterium]
MVALEQNRSAGKQAFTPSKKSRVTSLLMRESAAARESQRASQVFWRIAPQSWTPYLRREGSRPSGLEMVGLRGQIHRRQSPGKDIMTDASCLAVKEVFKLGLAQGAAGCYTSAFGSIPAAAFETASPAALMRPWIIMSMNVRKELKEATFRKDAPIAREKRRR